MNTMRENGNILIFGAEGASEILESMLKGSGYGVVRINEEETLLEKFEEESTELLLFDFETKAVNETESLALLAKLRQTSVHPIISIVDREKSMLRILSLNTGADDCIDVQSSPMECFARIQATIRCYKRLMEKREEKKCIKMDDLEVDDMTKVVSVKGNPVDLTPTEYKILHLLIQQPGRVLSNKQIYESIWKMSPIGADNTIAVHIRHIREKIEENPQEPRYLQVVWGQGYKVG